MIFAQNGAATHPWAGLGAFAQWNATATVQLAAGFQSAANLSGQTLSAARFGDDGFAWFGYAQWAPKFTGRGTAQYAISWFSSPSAALDPTRNHAWALSLRATLLF